MDTPTPADDPVAQLITSLFTRAQQVQPIASAIGEALRVAVIHDDTAPLRQLVRDEQARLQSEVARLTAATIPD